MAQPFDVIFYQGMNNSAAQITKYTSQAVMNYPEEGWYIQSPQLNYQSPFNVINNPYIGPEIADVNNMPLRRFSGWLNPINVITALITKIMNWFNGVRAYNMNNPQLSYTPCHAPNMSQISIGQTTDIQSHKAKYDAWFNNRLTINHNHSDSADNNDQLVLYGVSRGAGTTFSAIADYKYDHARLAILEGCFDSIDSVLKKRYGVAKPLISGALSFFTQYDKNGPSPIDKVDQYPANLPTVFITSRADREVPHENTRTLAQTLAAKGQNEVYLLELETLPTPHICSIMKQTATVTSVLYMPFMKNMTWSMTRSKQLEGVN